MRILSSVSYGVQIRVVPLNNTHNLKLMAQASRWLSFLWWIATTNMHSEILIHLHKVPGDDFKFQLFNRRHMHLAPSPFLNLRP